LKKSHGFGFKKKKGEESAFRVREGGGEAGRILGKKKGPPFRFPLAPERKKKKRGGKREKKLNSIRRSDGGGRKGTMIRPRGYGPANSTSAGFEIRRGKKKKERGDDVIYFSDDERRK